MEKKEINVKTAVKGLINGFISYGVLILFLFAVVVIFISWQINQYKEYIDYDTLKYSLPAIAAFVIFFLIRATCQLSTHDLFKKCRVSKEDAQKISSRMNLFFVGCVVFCVALILVMLTVRFDNQKTNIQQSSDLYYSTYSEDYAQYLTLGLISDFQVDRATTLSQVLIVECGLLLGLFSLTSAQTNLIERYNYIPKDYEDDKSKEKEKVKA